MVPAQNPEQQVEAVVGVQVPPLGWQPQERLPSGSVWETP